MSTVIRVELPAYSHSFQVSVTPFSTIHDVKHAINKVCPGSPSPEGQRLLCRGRLLKDEEKVEDVWKSPDDSRVVHLAVHPTAWTSSPPLLQTSASQISAPRPTPTTLLSPGRSSTTQSWQTPLSRSVPYSPGTPFESISYIQYLHNMSFGVLSAGIIQPSPQPTTSEVETWRLSAQDFYRSRGWTWPSVFDAPFPSGSSTQEAVYQSVIVEGLPYLQLTTPNAMPTPAQVHALRVLTYTLPIVSMANDPMFYMPVNPYSHHPHTPATNLNQHLQQLGLPALRFAHVPGMNPNPNDANPLAPPGAGAVEIRAIPLRALMIPLVMLAFRTLLLLYFFSPSKRPLFGLLLSIWILYEAWNALRVVLNNGHERGAEGAAANPAALNAGAGPVAAQPARQPAGPGGNNINVAPPNTAAGRSNLHTILDHLALINLAAEDAILDTDAPAPAPGLGQKVKMFATLFLLTLYPAAWDRRRTMLRRREGRIRTEFNAREAALGEPAGDNTPEGEGRARSEEEQATVRAREQLVARHERRPAWLREYVDRVQYTEWVDDP